MDKTLLKNFAKESRKDLTQKISVKISSYFVEDDFKEEIKGDVVVLSNSAHNLTITRDKYEKRKVLITRIKELGLNQVIEEASYTWFNRFVAIRYMEINNMLPLTKDNESLNIRVLSSLDNKLDPEIMSYSNITNPELDLKINKDQYTELKSDSEKFEYILLKVCEKLGKVIPQVFDGVTDYINILSPHNLLTEESVVGKLISIPEENFKDVEVIGWLYQYYNQEEKDRVISAKKAYKKNEIPYATQLFTPDWIVKYMVENSLGKYWLENKESKDIYPSDNLYTNDNLYPSNSLKSNWKYYIEDAEQEPEVQAELDKLKNPNLNPKDITFIDPCSGSGHILVYAFEVLYQIYESYGYNKREIPKLILENNIYGLDIDDRAGQLSILSLLLKARAFDKELFKKDIKLNVYSIQESNYINESVLYDIRSKETNEIIDYVLEVFKDAKEYGSILKVENKDYQLLIDKINQVETLFRKEMEEKFIPLLKQAILLSNKYDIFVTNPPYNGKYNDKLKKYIYKNYPESKLDTFAVFMDLNLIKKNGYISIINQHSWMFINSFKKLRFDKIKKNTFNNFIHLGARAFEEISGERVQTVAYIAKNTFIDKYISKFIDLTSVNSAIKKEIAFIKKDYREYLIACSLFLNLPDWTFSYNATSSSLKILNENKKIDDISISKAGIVTGNDAIFLRFWFEPKYKDITFKPDVKSLLPKYCLFSKGGDNRFYYGNNLDIIKMNDLYDNSKINVSVRRGDKNYYFTKSICWSQMAGKNSKGFRMLENSVAGTSSPTIIANKNEHYNYLLGLLNSKISDYFINLLNPTMSTLTSNITNIPFIIGSTQAEIDKIVEENVKLSKIDWDSFEESWGFEKHPLIKFKNNNSIKESFKSWESFTEKQFNQLKANEEELNRIFIDIYGLQDELTPEVEEKDVTIRKAEEERDIKSLISYAVGCMFGRYSLDQDGLVYAGGDFDNSKYITFKADKDNVIPINDNNYFMDDIVVKFKEFIKVAFGEEKLHENLEYIADVLGKRNTETSEDTIRRYFINDFYKDHLKTYKKKPIYWLFDSGKANGFKCLVYMHRYEENLAAKIRIDYLHKIQRVFEKELDEVKYKLTGELSPNERKDAMNLQKDLSNKLTEIKEYNENLDHIANQKINIDLDDGVTVNYAKFESVLAKIK